MFYCRSVCVCVCAFLTVQLNLGIRPETHRNYACTCIGVVFHRMFRIPCAAELTGYRTCVCVCVNIYTCVCVCHVKA